MPPTPNQKGRGIRSFFEIEARALHRQFQAIETLIPAHNRRGSAHQGEEGRYIESLLRSFLNRHLPMDIRAFSGFIIRPATKTGIDDLSRVEAELDSHSSQLDIIVYESSRYPIYERFEEFVLVPPEGVVGVISVKKRLRLDDLSGELESLERASRLCEAKRLGKPHIGLFAFTSDESSLEKLGTEIFKRIESHSAGKPFDCMVNEVSIFDKLVVFKLREEPANPGTAQFVRVDCIDGDTGELALNVALQRMLQSILGVYYARQNGEAVHRPGFVSFRKGQFGDSPILGLVRSASHS